MPGSPLVADRMLGRVLLTGLRRRMRELSQLSSDSPNQVAKVHPASTRSSSDRPTRVRCHEPRRSTEVDSTHRLGAVSDRFEQAWAVVTGMLCLLVMLGLAFTGPLALVGAALILTLSVGLRWLVRLVMRHRHPSR